MVARIRDPHLRLNVVMTSGDTTVTTTTTTTTTTATTPKQHACVCVPLSVTGLEGVATLVQVHDRGVGVRERVRRVAPEEQWHHSLVISEWNEDRRLTTMSHGQNCAERRSHISAAFVVRALLSSAPAASPPSIAVVSRVLVWSCGRERRRSLMGDLDAMFVTRFEFELELDLSRVESNNSTRIEFEF